MGSRMKTQKCFSGVIEYEIPSGTSQLDSRSGKQYRGNDGLEGDLRGRINRTEQLNRYLACKSGGVQDATQDSVWVTQWMAPTIRMQGIQGSQVEGKLGGSLSESQNLQCFVQSVVASSYQGKWTLSILSGWKLSEGRNWFSPPRDRIA